jgi:hypothetical protein
LPFQPPQAVAAAPATPSAGVPILVPPPPVPLTPRRSPLVPLAYGVLFLVGLAAGYVLLRALPPRATVGTSDKAKVDQPSGKEVGTTPVAKETREQTDDPAPRGRRQTDFGHPLGAAPQPGAVVVPTAVPVLTLPENVVEALGSLTASHLYQTYLNIGLLADAVEGEVYEVAEAKSMLATVVSLTSAVEEQLAQLAKKGVEGDDKKLVEQARQIAALLQTQTKELKGYWETQDKARAARFHKAREQAWTDIKALLNIKE